jgi:hypothetical protein
MPIPFRWMLKLAFLIGGEVAKIQSSENTPFFSVKKENTNCRSSPGNNLESA